MLVYRLAKEKYIRDLSGTGARIYGGRWNKKGSSMLYTSSHSSLALLELLVHTPHSLVPNDIHLLKLSIPDEVAITKWLEQDLPSSWQQYPAPDTLAAMGNQWLMRQKSVGLKVPSVLAPDEYNILLNPLHADMQQLQIKSVTPFSIDARFYTHL